MIGVVGGIDHDLKAFLDQRLGGAQRLHDVRKEGLGITQYFQLHQRVPIEQLARQPERAHGVLRGVTARSVGQDGELAGRQHLEQARLVGVLANVGAPNGHGDDLRTARIDGLARLCEILVLACADEQARGIGFTGDDQLVHKPPCVLSTTHCHDDLDPVSVGELLLLQAATRHDLAVSLQRHPFAREFEPGDELCGGNRCVEAARFAVYSEGYHAKNTAFGTNPILARVPFCPDKPGSLANRVGQDKLARGQARPTAGPLPRRDTRPVRRPPEP